MDKRLRERMKLCSEDELVIMERGAEFDGVVYFMESAVWLPAARAAVAIEEGQARRPSWQVH